MEQTELVKLIFSATVSLAGILVGIIFIIYGLIDSWSGQSGDVSRYYKSVIRFLGGIFLVITLTLLLSFLYLLDIGIVYVVVALFILIIFLIIASVLMLVMRRS